jgi:ABC-type Fe3+/spermidine/putrescine transport system ATPase subunit
VASVELRGLTKRYGTLAVVDDVSLRIEHGLLVCLLGPSGCGKTTTLRLIAGFVEPTAGEIAVGDRVVSSTARTLPPEQRNMSMIFQSYALWPHMTVTENVAYGLTLRKLDKALIARKVQDDPFRHQARSACRTLSGRALGRAAAARRARARADRRAGDAAARRAALESRRQSARGDALRGAPPARRVPLHHRST